MADLNSVLKMLESPSEAERRKAIELLARSGAPKAYDYLKAAYPRETSAELRTLMIEAGQQIKLKQTQSAPSAAKKTTTQTRIAAKKATSTSTNRPVKPPTKPTLDLPAYEAFGDEGNPDKKKKNAPATAFSAKAVQFVMALIVAACGFGISMSISQPWVNLAGLPYQRGTLGSYIEEIKNGIRTMPNNENIRQSVHQEHVSYIDAGFGSYDISSMLNGERSGWDAIFTIDYLRDMAQQYTGRVFPDVHEQANSQSLDGMLFWATFIGLIICILGFNIVWRLIFGFNNFALFGLLGLLLQTMGMRATWIVALVSGVLTLLLSLYFFVSMLPRFVPMAMTSLGIGEQSYNNLSLLGTGFIINTLAALVVIIVSGYVLMEDSISANEAA